MYILFKTKHILTKTQDSFRTFNAKQLQSVLIRLTSNIIAIFTDVWGFDDSAVAVLQGMKQSSELEESQASEVSSLEKYAILLKGGHSASVLSSNITQQKSSTMRLQKVCVYVII